MTVEWEAITAIVAGFSVAAAGAAQYVSTTISLKMDRFKLELLDEMRRTYVEKLSYEHVALLRDVAQLRERLSPTKKTGDDKYATYNSENS